MTDVFALIDRLADLESPSVTDIESLLCTTLVHDPHLSHPYRLYEGRSELDFIRRIDFRVPRFRKGPILVIDLWNISTTLKDLEKRYGVPEMTDLSAHHPGFIGYKIVVSDREIGITADSTTHILMSVSF